jgi:arabinofuranan 3-O-arabinosyltransferase
LLSPLPVAPDDSGVTHPDVTSVMADHGGVDHEQVTLPTRTEQSVLALPRNANPGWSAELAGQSLTAVRVDGWQQGWLIPPGAAATLDVRFGPDRWYRDGLMVGLAAALLVMVLTALPVRRRVDRPPATERSGRWWWWLVGPTLLAAVAGAVGVGLAALAAGGWALLGRRSVSHRGVAAAWLVVALVLVGGGAVVLAPSRQLAGPGADLVQGMMLAAVAVVWAASSTPAEDSGHEPAQSQRRPLDQVPAGGRDERGGEIGDEQDQGEGPAEQ